MYNLRKPYEECAVPGCSSNSTKTPNLTFFRIPRDGARQRKWLKNIHREELLDSEHEIRKLNVCELHFSKILKNDGKNAISASFCPTLKIPNKATNNIKNRNKSTPSRIKKEEVKIESDDESYISPSETSSASIISIKEEECEIIEASSITNLPINPKVETKAISANKPSRYEIDDEELDQSQYINPGLYQLITKEFEEVNNFKLDYREVSNKRDIGTNTTICTPRGLHFASTTGEMRYFFSLCDLYLGKTLASMCRKEAIKRSRNPIDKVVEKKPVKRKYQK